MRGKRGTGKVSPCPPERKGAKTTDNVQAIKETLALLWNYVIEVQDLIADLRELCHDDEEIVLAPYPAGLRPADIIAAMIEEAKGAPMRVGDTATACKNA